MLRLLGLGYRKYVYIGFSCILLLYIVYSGDFLYGASKGQKQGVIEEIRKNKSNSYVEGERSALRTALSVQRAIRNVAKSVTPSVVNIRTEKTVKRGGNFPNPFFKFFEDFYGGERKLRSLGSGFVLSEKGYIVTNNHVIDGADDITVLFPDEKEYKGKIVSIDSRTDIAVIKIEPRGGHKIPATPLGDSDSANIGDFAIAIGNPFGLKGTFTFGVISARGRDDIDADAGFKNYIQTDASINQGNSGGPLLNIRGQAIGMNTSIYSTTGGSIGIGFAIPINIVKRIVISLIDKGVIPRGFLGVGITQIPDDVAKHFGISKSKGIFVQHVEAGGPASKAGIKPGDIILKVNGHKINSTSKLQRLISSYEEGTRVSIEIFRNGRKRKISVILGTYSASKTARKGEKKFHTDKPVSYLGLAVGGVKEHYKYFGLKSSDKGVVVLKVQQGSPAYKAGIRAGDLVQSINFVELGSVRDFERFFKSGQSRKDSFLIYVRRGTRSQFVVVKKK